MLYIFNFFFQTAVTNLHGKLETVVESLILAQEGLNIVRDFTYYTAYIKLNQMFDCFTKSLRVKLNV